MIIRTNKQGLALASIVMGILALVIPEGWDTAPLAKLRMAAFFLGMGWLGLKYP
jgi:hypothetical protein